jgi:anhydro-N-acetylmuramic acid kinase
VYNDFLIENIQNRLPELAVVIPENIRIQRALIFGLLGVLKLRGEINTLSSVTKTQS